MIDKHIDESFGSIMIIVPHEDDELLMTAGVIKSALNSGLDVKVVLATNGDYGASDFSIGRTRMKESLDGLTLLGLDRENVIFLGYADTGMPKEESFIGRLYEESDINRIIPSGCSEKTYSLEDGNTYHFKNFSEEGSYCRKDFLGDLEGVIKEYKPMNIFTTSQFDNHGDHSYLYLFVVDVLRELKEEGIKIDLYSGIVHSFDGDENWPIITENIERFTVPKSLEETSNLKREECLSFRVPMEMQSNINHLNLKWNVINQHKTALKPDAIEFLFSFVKMDEVFWKIDY
ncbi:PIG-L deacetylase family protein [Clostridium sp. B9]|uniref:PIG-L deacetylase family protein n=1 Tax=Clostridium sp. B9 TaxID=3423224 RepID=UPI003D2EA94C